MTNIKPGSRVRIEWPVGFAVEGIVRPACSGPYVSDYAGGVSWRAEGNAFGDGRKVTVLEEPKPILPTEPGSVVIAHTANNNSTRRVLMLCVSAGLRLWRDNRNVCFDTKELIDPIPVTLVPTEDVDALIAEAHNVVDVHGAAAHRLFPRVIDILTKAKEGQA